MTELGRFILIRIFSTGQFLRSPLAVTILTPVHPQLDSIFFGSIKNRLPKAFLSREIGAKGII